MIVWPVAAVVLVGVLVRQGVLGRRGLAAAPERAGALSPLDLLIVFGLVMFGYLGLGLVLAVFTGGVETLDKADPVTQIRVVWLQYVCLAPAIGFILIRASSAMRGGLGGFGFALSRPFWTALWTLATILTLIVVYPSVGLIVGELGELITGEPPPAIAHPLLEAIVESDVSKRMLLIIPAVVLAPIFEEIMYRGMLQTTLLNTGVLPGRWSVVVVASVVFTGIHAGGVDWQALPSLFVLSLCLGYAYERTGRLWPSILIHMLFNAANVALAFVQFGD